MTQEDRKSPEHFDLAFVGAGLSTAHTLYCLLEKRRSSDGPPLNIAVFEKTSDWYQGIAYGDRSGSEGLLINTVGEFLGEPEKTPFREWILANADALVEQIAERRFGAIWLEKFGDDFTAGNLDDLYVPRFVFGQYTRNNVARAVANAADAGTATVTRFQHEVSDITSVGQRYQLVSHDGHGHHTQHSADKIILALGSPPMGNLPVGNAVGDSGSDPVLDPFDMGMAEMLDAVHSRLTESANGSARNVVIVGSNASAMDVVYNLGNHSALINQVGKIHLLSMSGENPRLIDSTIEYRDVWDADTVAALKTQSPLAADTILNAVAEDMARADALSVPAAVTIPTVSRRVFELLGQLDAAQLRRFVAFTGTAIGKLQRRAGTEYHGMLQSLVARGKLQNTAGAYLGISDYAEHTFSVDYDNSTHCAQIENVAAVINCTGFQALDANSKNPLLRNLASSGLCAVNESNMGFEVDDRMQAAKNVYVLGPMLAGNILSSGPIWHMEHAGRVMSYAEKLATTMLDGTV
ncbi:MAG: FAD/NAD(P)-binding protein [Pseudomonadota bacterium]